MKAILVLAALALTLTACAKKPSAMSVCEKIQASGVGTNCRVGTAAGLGAGAAEVASFDLPSVPGKGGAVYRFDTEQVFTSTVAAYAGAAALAGPHRYGSQKALIFVQMNDGLAAAKGSQVKAIVDAL